MSEIKNPRHYDTEYFTFTYSVPKNTLLVRLKNENIDHCSEGDVYTTSINGRIGIVAVEIKNIFGSTEIPMLTHIHKLNEFFLPWFKINHDVRRELARAIERFYALESYDSLEYGPDQYRLMEQKLTELMAGIKEKLPEKVAERDLMRERLSANCQDKGISADSGTSFFPTTDLTWILEETDTRVEDRPEYVWRVIKFDGAIGDAKSINILCVGTNHACFNAIMEDQRTHYGICALDLDVLNNKLESVKTTIHQIELILDIPEADSLLDSLESNF